MSCVLAGDELERLRIELTKAEEEFRHASTPESKLQTLDRFHQELAEFSFEMLSCKHHPLARLDRESSPLAPAGLNLWMNTVVTIYGEDGFLSRHRS